MPIAKAISVAIGTALRTRQRAADSATLHHAHRTRQEGRPAGASCCAPAGHGRASGATGVQGEVHGHWHNHPAESADAGEERLAHAGKRTVHEFLLDVDSDDEEKDGLRRRHKGMEKGERRKDGAQRRRAWRRADGARRGEGNARRAIRPSLTHSLRDMLSPSAAGPYAR